MKTITGISDLSTDELNANAGTERGYEMVESSLAQYGAGRSIVVDKNGKVIGGNKTLEKAVQLGLGIEVVETTGDRLVVVQRVGLDMDTDPRARELVIADNRSAELGLNWDDGNLAALADAGVDLSKFWTEGELDVLLEDVDGASEVIADGELEPELDKIEELRKKWGVALGDVWKCGEHRVVCGGSTDAGVIEKCLKGEESILCVADPPYGVEYDPGWRNQAAEKGLISKAARSVGKVQNDDNAGWSSVYNLIDAQVMYVWHADRRAREVQGSIENSGYVIINQIIWSKPMFAISRGDYHWQHEPCWHAHKKGKTHNWQGARDQSTLWGIERGCGEKTGHGAEKPIECMARPIRNNTSKGQVVCDPFLGSGTTLIACALEGRICRGIDIGPAMSQWHWSGMKKQQGQLR